MKGLLSRIELLIVAVFLIIFLMWAGSRCKETKSRLQEEAMEQTEGDSLTNIDTKPADDILEEALEEKKDELAARSIPDSLDSGATSTVAAAPSIALGKLYITIDKLKIRSEPGLKSKVLGELPLFSEVYFMEEVTDSLYTVSLGKEVATEPYVKVKTKRGTVGWVYGAGVNYYKKKTEGVLE